MKISSRNIIKWAEVFGSEAFLYTGSHSNPEEYTNLIVNDQLNPGRGAGSMYGKGVYTVYNLQGTNTSRGVYGKWIYKLRVNLYGFISFNDDITNKIYGQSLTPAEQYEKIYGHNKTIISVLKNLDYENYNFKNNTSSELALRASHFLKGLVKGIVFTGKRDGDVAVIYDPSIITLVSYKDLENNPDGWSRFDQEMIRSTISKSLLGNFRKSIYEETDDIVDVRYQKNKTYLKNLIKIKGDVTKDTKALKYIGFLVSNNPFNFIKNFFDKDWAQPYIETAVKNIMVKINPEDLIEFLEKSDNNVLTSPICKPLIKNFVENYPDKFIFNYNLKEKEFYQDFIHLAMEALAQKDPRMFIQKFLVDRFTFRNFDSNIYRPYFSIAFKKLFDIKPSDAIRYSKDSYVGSKEWINEPWAKEYIIASAEELIKQHPPSLLEYVNESWAKEDWFKRYIIEAVQKSAEKNPENILYYLLDDDKKYLLEEEWMRPYLSIAAKQYIRFSPKKFLESCSDYDWAKPYLGLAFEGFEKEVLRDMSFFRTPVGIAGFLKNYGNKEDFKPHINIIIQLLAEKTPGVILSDFKNEQWANTPVESIGGKTWVEYAEELIRKQDEAQSGGIVSNGRFKNKIIKLAKFIGNIGLNKEATQILKLASKEVFAHISGPSGSGKTTIMEEINSLYPDVVTKDLDEFDEEATEEMGLDPLWKQTSWSEELQREHYKIKQKLLDDFIMDNAGRKILLVGIHNEGAESLSFNAKHKILLDTSPKESMERRIKRDSEWGKGWNFWDSEEDILSELQESEEIVRYLMTESYVPMSRDEILSLFEN